MRKLIDAFMRIGEQMEETPFEFMLKGMCLCCVLGFVIWVIERVMIALI